MLHDAGILVPESARFTLEGDGELTINLNNQQFYGIGNNLSSTHGEINIMLEGTLNINGRGTNGICIGSGNGGKINVLGGDIYLVNNGGEGVCIGSYKSDSDLNISNCSINMDVSLNKGVGIGSIEGSTTISTSQCSCSFTGDGLEVVGFGTIKGERSTINIYNSLAEFDIGGDRSIAIGAMDGQTEADVRIASVRVKSAGKEALAFGGYNENSRIKLTGVDTRVELHNSIGKDTMAPDDAIEIVNGRCKIKVNDEEIERQLVYKF